MKKQLNHFLIEGLDRLIALALIVLLSPVWLLNIITAIASLKPVLVKKNYWHINGESLQLAEFNCGYLKASFKIYYVLQGNILLSGLPLLEQADLLPASVAQSFRYNRNKAGFYSLYGIQKTIGILDINQQSCYERIVAQQTPSFKDHLVLLSKGLFCQLFYQTRLPAPKNFRLFGIGIHNLTTKQAVAQITAPRRQHCRLNFFINVNSVNLAWNDEVFKHALNQGDLLLADGSGVRIAAKQSGIALKDNLNGTDLLPHLCLEACKEQLSIYLLGAEPGVAEQMKENLKKCYPKLKIAGTHHGYFSEDKSSDVIKQVNQSQCNLLLVAMGSPNQEQWLLKHRDQLHCRSALAVGGQFDFYAGKVSRAPQWMRELGLEWIWRLVQQPQDKWRRYILGNPLFLLRLLISRLTFNPAAKVES